MYGYRAQDILQQEEERLRHEIEQQSIENEIQRKKDEYEEKLDGLRYARFFIALILNDLLSEKSITQIFF